MLALGPSDPPFQRLDDGPAPEGQPLLTVRRAPRGPLRQWWAVHLFSEGLIMVPCPIHTDLSPRHRGPSCFPLIGDRTPCIRRPPRRRARDVVTAFAPSLSTVDPAVGFACLLLIHHLTALPTPWRHWLRLLDHTHQTDLGKPAVLGAGRGGGYERRCNAGKRLHLLPPLLFFLRNQVSSLSNKTYLILYLFSSFFSMSRQCRRAGARQRCLP